MVKHYLEKICGLVAWKLTPVRRKLEKMTNVHWYEWPFGHEPRASEKEYLRLAKEVSEQNYQEIDKYEHDSRFALNKDWLVELALHTQVVIKETPLCYAHGRVLYTALSKYLSEHPSSSSTDRLTIWETGTARGFSALCMAKALKDQGRPGTILTFDVLPHRTAMYWNCIDDCEKPKTRAELLKTWKDLLQDFVIFHQGDTSLELLKVQAERIHFAFLDGAHTYKDVMFEFQQIRERQETGDIIVYDDYTPQQFPGLVRAVDEICEQYQYQRTDLQAHSGRRYVIAVKN
jgi:hypothetical protein